MLEATAVVRASREMVLRGVAPLKGIYSVFPQNYAISQHTRLNQIGYESGVPITAQHAAIGRSLAFGKG